MMTRAWLLVSAAGFVASGLLHLGTFTPAASRLGESYAAVLFAAACVPLVAMMRRLRRLPLSGRRWGRLHVLDWREIVAPVPPPARVLIFGAALYVLMNSVLSLAVIGGVSVEAGGGAYHAVEHGERREISRAEYDAHRAAALRGLSAPLLLFYLLPLAYFAFVPPPPGAARLPASFANGGGP
jgi:hypothetical protein